MNRRGQVATWERLLTLARDPAREADLLGRLVERWCEEAGAAGAALYLEEDGGAKRERAVGAGPFPPLAPAPEAVPEHLASLMLPGGLLLYAPGAGSGGEGVATVPSCLALALLTRICELRRQLKRQSFEASYRGVEQQALYDVGLAITSTLNLDDLSEAILTWALALLDARRAALYLVAEGRYHLSRALGGDARESFVAADTDALPEELLPGASHLLPARIEIEGDPRGLLVVADKESRYGVGPFGESDRRTLNLFANQAAIALENAYLHRQALEKERLEREMVLAAEIQRQILPDGVPEVQGFELAGWNRSAREVGGDYYDLLTRPDGKLIAAVGDVSGKGMPAALMVSILHSALRLMLDRHQVGPELIERLNRHVLDSSAPNKFITLVVAQLDPTSGRLLYVNAGHNPGLVVGSDGGVRQLSSSGLPVGLLPDVSYQTNAVDLGAGDLVCLYSDGITESTNPTDEEFETDRLVELLTQHRQRPLEEIVSAIDAAVTDFAQGRPQADDQTVVLLRRRG